MKITQRSQAVVCIISITRILEGFHLKKGNVAVYLSTIESLKYHHHICCWADTLTSPEFAQTSSCP